MEYTSTVNLDDPFLAIFIALIARQPGLGHLKSKALSAHTSFQLTLAETEVESIHPWKLTCWTEKSPICNGKSSWKTSVILFHVNFPRCKVHCGCLQQVCLFPQMSGVQLLLRGRSICCITFLQRLSNICGHTLYPPGNYPSPWNYEPFVSILMVVTCCHINLCCSDLTSSWSTVPPLYLRASTPVQEKCNSLRPVMENTRS